MPEASFCIGSETQFSSASSFLPGENVTITCSAPAVVGIWDSPWFSDSVFLTPLFGATRSTRLDGAIVFNLKELNSSSNSSCSISTATIANIQESIQGLSLICAYISDRVIKTTVVIDVVGKVSVVLKMMLNFMMSLINSFISCYICYSWLGSKWMGQPPVNECIGVLSLNVHVQNSSHVF